MWYPRHFTVQNCVRKIFISGQQKNVQKIAMCQNNRVNWGVSDIFFIKPAQSAGFSRIKKIPYQPLRLNWGPENVHFGKKHLRDPNINARI